MSKMTLYFENSIQIKAEVKLKNTSLIKFLFIYISQVKKEQYRDCVFPTELG